MWGIQRWPVNSSHKRPVTRKRFPFDDVIMNIKVCYSPHVLSDCYSNHICCNQDLSVGDSFRLRRYYKVMLSRRPWFGNSGNLFNSLKFTHYVQTLMSLHHCSWIPLRFLCWRHYLERVFRESMTHGRKVFQWHTQICYSYHANRNPHIGCEDQFGLGNYLRAILSRNPWFNKTEVTFPSAKYIKCYIFSIAWH